MKVQCPQCVITFDVPDIYVGKTVKCLKCNQSFTASSKNIYDESSLNGFSKNFWTFRVMLTPKLIIVIFPVWCIITGLAALLWATSAEYSTTNSKLFTLAIAILVWLINVIGIRIVCEWLIVIFRIHDTLEEIRKK
jgi:uncharacterized paraquat-inducible protein A